MSGGGRQPEANRYCGQTAAVWCTPAFRRAVQRIYPHPCRPWHFVLMSEPPREQVADNHMTTFDVGLGFGQDRPTITRS
jgi:hypothetical protein